MLEDRLRWVVVFVFDRRRGMFTSFHIHFPSGNIKLTGPPEFPANQEISYPNGDPVRRSAGCGRARTSPQRPTSSRRRGDSAMCLPERQRTKGGLGSNSWLRGIDGLHTFTLFPSIFQ